MTRVGADHMGRFIREQLVREGVDVRGVLADSDRLTALVILGIRDRETFPLIFYRENCADMALCEQDLDPAWLGSARAVLINGTHLSTPGVFAASLGAARHVKAAGGRVVFDIDYRPVLWGVAAKDLGESRYVAHAGVTRRLQDVLPLCDLVVGTEEEIRILGGVEDTLAALKIVRARTSATIVCKRGAQGCVAFPGPVPDDIEDGRRRCRLSRRGVQRSRSGRCLPGRISRAAGCGTSRSSNAVGSATPAEQSWSHGTAARLRCRLGRSWSFSSRHATASFACARMRSSNTRTGQQLARGPTKN